MYLGIPSNLKYPLENVSHSTKNVIYYGLYWFSKCDWNDIFEKKNSDWNLSGLLVGWITPPPPTPKYGQVLVPSSYDYVTLHGEWSVANVITLWSWDKTTLGGSLCNHKSSSKWEAGGSGGASGKEPVSQWRRHKRTWVPSLGWEDPLKEGSPEGSSGSSFLKEETAAHASLLTWRLPWSEEPAGLQSIVSQRTWHNWSDLARTHRRLRVRKDMRIKANREKDWKVLRCWLKMEEGDSDWGMQAVFRSWKMQRGRLIPRASGRNAALLTPWL